MIKFIKDNLIWIIIIAFMGFLMITQGCNNKKEISRLERNYQIEKEGIQSELLKNGQELNTVRSKLLSKDELLNQLNDTITEITKKYKNVKAALSIKSTIKRDTLYIPYDSIINHVFSRTFKHETEFSKITGLSTNEGVRIDTNESYNEQNIVFGDKKEGWFKTEQSVSITNSNPNVKTTGIQSSVITERKKRFGLGPTIGYNFLTGEIYVGVGVSYDVVRF